MSEKLLEVKNLRVSYHTYAGEVQSVRGVSFTVNKGETVAVVGESGCGKSVTAKSIMRRGCAPVQRKAPLRLPRRRGGHGVPGRAGGPEPHHDRGQPDH